MRARRCARSGNAGAPQSTGPRPPDPRVRASDTSPSRNTGRGAEASTPARLGRSQKPSPPCTAGNANHTYEKHLSAHRALQSRVTSGESVISDPLKGALPPFSIILNRKESHRSQFSEQRQPCMGGGGHDDPTSMPQPGSRAWGRAGRRVPGRQRRVGPARSSQKPPRTRGVAPQDSDPCFRRTGAWRHPHPRETRRLDGLVPSLLLFPAEGA